MGLLGLLLLLVVPSSSSFGWGWSLPVLQLKSFGRDVFSLPQLKYVGPDVFDPASVSQFCFPGLRMGANRLTQIFLFLLLVFSRAEN